MDKPVKKAEEKPEEIKVNFCKDSRYLYEISQAVAMEYAFLSTDYKQCHQWVKCRDFLNDVLRGQVTGKKNTVYGFEYNPAVNPPMNLEKMSMLVRCNAVAKNTKEIMVAALAAIHCVEERGGIKPLSKTYPVAEHEDIYIFEGATDWIESTFMISLYTLLIRLGAKKIVFQDREEFDAKLEGLCSKPASYSDNDITYLRTVRTFIHKVVEKRKDLKYVREDGKLLFDNKSITVFHGFSGVVALCQEAVRIKEKKSRPNNVLEDLNALASHIS